jgi:4-amino-4-deoxy-L-arabinose transferase-like glycosyltransferase
MFRNRSMEDTSQTKRSLAVGLALFIGLVVMRLPLLLYPYDVNDEALYSITATEILEGARPYVDAIDRKPPFLYWTYALAYAAGGKYNARVLHVASVLWTALTMLALYFTARRLFDRRAGLVAAVLYAVYVGWGTYPNLAWNGEMLLNLPLCWAIYLVFRPSRSPVRLELLPAGALMAAAFLYKQPAAAAAVPLGVYLLLPSYRQARGLRVVHSLLQGALFTAGFALVLGAVVWHLHARGLLADAYFWTIKHHDMPHGPLDIIFWERLIVGGTWFALACFLPLAAAAAALRPGGSAVSWAALQPERTAIRGLLVAAIFGLCASGRFYTHYFILLLPAVVLAAAPVLAGLWASTVPDGPWPLRRRSSQRVFAATAAVFFVAQAVGLAVSARRGSSEAAIYIREHSDPQDKVFVWGEHPRLYFEARRRPASRFTCTYPLTGYPYGGAISYEPHYLDTRDRIVPGTWAVLEQELAQNRPRFIVDVESKMRVPRYPVASTPLIARVLAEHYRIVYSARDGIIHERVD